MLQAVDSLQLATDIELASRVVEVLHSRVRLIIVAKDLSGLLDPSCSISPSALRFILTCCSTGPLVRLQQMDGATHLSGL